MNKVAKLAVASAVAMVLASTVSGSLLPGFVAAAHAEDAKPDAKPQVSAAAGKDLQDAQKAMQATKWDDAITSLDKVKANPKKNDYDEYIMNQFYVTAYANLKKLNEATGPLEALIASKYITPDDLKKRITQAAFLYYQLKNYDKAIEWGTRSLKEGDGNPQVPQVVAQSYYLKEDFKGTDQFVTGVVGDEIKAGQTPDDEMLQLGLSAAIKDKDDASEQHWLLLLVQYHPKPEYWDNILAGLYQQKPSDKQLLEIYRLSLEVGAMTRGADYTDTAQFALNAGSPGEAVAVLNKAFANNVYTDPAEKARNQHLLESAKKQAATDEPSLDKLETEANASAAGDKLIGVGIGYFGYGHYDKAAKDIAAGLAKGTTKDNQDNHLILGIAQFKSGDKEAAIKTFESVKGDPILERVAKLWEVHVKAAA